MNPRRALAQHSALIRVVRALGASVLTVPFVHGAFDSVFAKDNALYAQRADTTHALFAEPRYRERQAEQSVRRSDLQHAGISIEPATAAFEGGDVVVVPGRFAFLGHGFRSSPAAANTLERFLGLPVIPLELVDPALYHLDTALGILGDGTALACDDAFSPHSREVLRRVCPVMPVSREEALRFAVNFVDVGRAVVTGTDSEEVTEILSSLGRRTVYTPLDEFHRAGGSAACLLAPIYDQPTLAIAATTAIRSTVA
ncbi:MAG TPA: arginine deiminase-related protein [Kofleriaceae bacterium]|nr:arginine deiminase-related protein [Kofleriaceae bacterium]